MFTMTGLNIYVKHLCAETLNIQSQLSVITKQNTIDIILKISNKGQATAYDITSRIQFLGELKASRTIHRLNAGFSETISMIFDLQKNMKGDYPLIAEIKFHDLNLYPFYSLSCSSIHIHSQKGKNRLTVHVPDIEFSEQYITNVHVDNQDGLKKNLSVQMIVPGGFACKNNTVSRLLPKGQSVDIEYDILKKDALPNTTHYGFVLITYKENAISHAQVTPFKICVKPVTRVFLFEKQFVASAWIFFGLIWILSLTFVSFRNRHNQ